MAKCTAKVVATVRPAKAESGTKARCNKRPDDARKTWSNPGRHEKLPSATRPSISFMPSIHPGNHVCTMPRKTRNWPAATSSREEANWPSLRALSRRLPVGFSVLLESAMTLDLRASRARTNCMAGPADCAKTLGKISSSQAKSVSASSILIGQREQHQVKLRIEPSQKRERNLHHEQQRQKRQHQAETRGENGGSRPGSCE